MLKSWLTQRNECLLSESPRQLVDVADLYKTWKVSDIKIQWETLQELPNLWKHSAFTENSGQSRPYSTLTNIYAKALFFILEHPSML